jgi:hypothetical protein
MRVWCRFVDVRTAFTEPARTWVDAAPDAIDRRRTMACDRRHRVAVIA